MTVAYRTEEEQWEVIKQWWRKNQQWISLLLGVVLLACAGLRYWTWHQEQQGQVASRIYENMMNAAGLGQENAVQAYANQLINDHHGTLYAISAQLLQAKLAVHAGALDKAREALLWVVEHGKISAFRTIALIRLARLDWEEKQAEAALKRLAIPIDTAYLPLVDELRGDIQLSLGNITEARASYEKAMHALQDKALSIDLLEIKISQLPKIEGRS